MNLGLPLSTCCDETQPFPLSLRVKEEEYGPIITWQHEEEKPIEDLHCKTVSDFTESLSSTYNETPTVSSQVKSSAAEVKVKKEVDEQQHNDCLLETMSPNAQIAALKLRHELEMAKQKIEWQQEMIKQLTKERDFLREQLAMTTRKKYKGVKSEDGTNPSQPVSSEFSDSTDDSSSADEGLKKKTKNSKRVKRRKQGKRVKQRKEPSLVPERYQRARDSEEVVARYKKVLSVYRKGKTMVAAFRAVGVDRNTIVANAPIAELFIAAPERYAELKDKRPEKEKLRCFAQRCKDAIEADESIDKIIKYYKESSKLLPMNKGR